MKITELLNLLDEKYKSENPHKLIMFGDYSGGIQDNNEEELIEFFSEDEMQEKLNELYKNIKEEDIKFEL